jgi:hypothetical protein
MVLTKNTTEAMSISSEELPMDFIVFSEICGTISLVLSTLFTSLFSM